MRYNSGSMSRTPSHEKIQIVDGHDRLIGSTTREKAWRDGLAHRIVRILIQDELGRVLLQRRSEAKRSYPGRWTDAATGHVDEGETPESAASRELAEELGISSPIKFLGKFRVTDTDPTCKIMDAFHYVYAGKFDEAGDLHPDPEEVSEVRWYDPDELDHDITKTPDHFTPGLVEVWRRYGTKTDTQ